MSPNSGKYAYFAGGYADDHSGPALGVADSLKPETRNLKPPVRKAFRTGSSMEDEVGKYFWVRVRAALTEEAGFETSTVIQGRTDLCGFAFSNPKIGRFLPQRRDR